MAGHRATRLTLLCRGATEANHTSRFTADEPLLAGELEKLAALAGRLSAFDGVISAPERSARDTADALGRPVEIVSELADIDYGRWKDRTLSEIAMEAPADLQVWIADPTAAPHGGESIEQAAARVAGWLDGELTGGGHRVVVTHAIILKIALAHILRAPLTSVWSIDVEPLGSLKITSNGARWALRSLG